MCKKLTIQEIVFLRDLYKVDWPKFVPTFVLLSHFIERFDKNHEWQEKVHFLTVNIGSLKNGTFLMIYCNYIVCLNSLEAAPYENLQILLNQLDFSEEKKFWAIEAHHADVVLKIQKSKNLEIVYDESSKCTFYQFDLNEIASSLKLLTIPHGFYYDSLKVDDVPLLIANSYYKMPPWYFENVIQHNITTGLYTNDGKLVAWTGIHEVGESGLTNVDAKYRRQKLALGVLSQQTFKALQAGKVIFGHVFDNNVTAVDLFDSIGHAKIVGRHRWINLRKGKSTKSQL
ncbi:hypothetical protein Bhyg_12278 [Pseudolycoriella hygida]|uniref:GCN5-related N-acetyltransferase Rv2170-like domain-containing protein n=1 Tax=Pseudolycoriella hygida TaxID=35572 RepID=A0A9Q0MWY7_9DIPT|nr:hypothetical protein Bhyg_12278 [Pseudolycoriella hygida]